MPSSQHSLVRLTPPQALDRYLLEQRRYFKCQLISYTGKNKNRYQMEIPESVEKHTELPDDFKFQSQRKGYRRCVGVLV